MDENIKADETKVIKMHQSSVLNSPLLASDSVETKDYTTNIAAINEPVKSESNNVQEKEIQQPKEQPKEQQKTDGFFEKENSYEAPESEFPADPTNNTELEDDGIENMQINAEDPLGQGIEGVLTDAEAGMKAKALLNGYNMAVPPLLFKQIKSEPEQVRHIMSFNEVPNKDIKEVERFLNNSNKEIFNALKLNSDEMMVLRPPLAKVLQKYNVTSDNPLVNLLSAVVGVGIGKYMAIKEITDKQTAQLEMIIDGYQLRMPEGYEDFPKKKKIVKLKRKKQEMQEAA